LTKSNSLETLSKLMKSVKDKKVSNVFLIDNAKLEAMYSNVSQIDFFTIANKAIVEPLDVFNTLSSQPSFNKALDAMEWLKLCIDGEGLSIYGELTIHNYTEDTAIAESIITNLNSNLLASDFDLKQSKYVGFMIVANEDVWARIPSSSINYASAMLNDVCGNPVAIYKGIYKSDIKENVVKVYSIFSGLGLPTERVDQLKNEIKDLQSKTKNKIEQRNLSLNLSSSENNETISAAQKVKDKISAKSSVFGKFTSNIIDKRK
jgi:hypothetical protein